MAFSAIASTSEPRAFSLGPLKVEIQTFSAVSTDTSGTVTATRLSRVDDVLVMGSGSLCQTAAPSISGLTATLALADPASGCAGYAAKNVNGYILIFGR